MSGKLSFLMSYCRAGKDSSLLGGHISWLFLLAVFSTSIFSRGCASSLWKKKALSAHFHVTVAYAVWILYTKGVPEGRYTDSRIEFQVVSITSFSS